MDDGRKSWIRHGWSFVPSVVYDNFSRCWPFTFAHRPISVFWTFNIDTLLRVHRTPKSRCSLFDCSGCLANSKNFKFWRAANKPNSLNRPNSELDRTSHSVRSLQLYICSFWILKVIWGHLITFGCDKNQLNDIISALETWIYQILEISDNFHPIKLDWIGFGLNIWLNKVSNMENMGFRSLIWGLNMGKHMADVKLGC